MGTGKNQCPCPRAGMRRWDYGKRLWQGRGRANKESHGRGKHAGKPHGERGWECDGRTGIERPLTPSQQPLFGTDGFHRHQQPCRAAVRAAVSREPIAPDHRSVRLSHRGSSRRWTDSWARPALMPDVAGYGPDCRPSAPSATGPDGQTRRRSTGSSPRTSRPGSPHASRATSPSRGTSKTSSGPTSAAASSASASPAPAARAVATGS
jgi:hypothetical protein